MSGAFVFEKEDKGGGQMVFCDFNFTAAWYDAISGKLYCVSGLNGDIYEWDDLAQPPTPMEWKSKVIKTKDMINLGAARVIADYGTAAPAMTAIWQDVLLAWEDAAYSWSGTTDVTFKLWVDKALIFTQTLSDNLMFRLPTGYRSDTFEFSVSGNVRVRAVHLAETPYGLKEA